MQKMSGVRKRHTSGFKAKVGLEAIKQEKTIVQLSGDHGVHPNLIRQWKKRILEEVPNIFRTQRKKKDRDAEKLQDELYRQIGQLKVELDWLKKKSEQLR
jgi:putative transposase